MIDSETGIEVVVGDLLDVTFIRIGPSRIVVLVVYACAADSVIGLRPSSEHTEVKFFLPEELASIALPDVYRTTLASVGIGGR